MNVLMLGDGEIDGDGGRVEQYAWRVRGKTEDRRPVLLPKHDKLPWGPCSVWVNSRGCARVSLGVQRRM